MSRGTSFPQLFVAIPQWAERLLKQSQLCERENIDEKILRHHLAADKLVLVDGQTPEGELISRNAQTVVFAIAGQQLSFPTANVKSIELDMTPQAEEASATAAAVPAQSGLVVPVGTRLVAKTNEAIDSKRQKQGHRFTASLESALIVDGKTLAPRGAAVYGVLTEVKKSRRAVGSSELHRNSYRRANGRY